MEDLKKGWVQITVKTVGGEMGIVSVKEDDWDTDGEILTLKFKDGDKVASINYPLRNVLCYTTRRIE